MRLSSPIYMLKRQARRQAREAHVPLHEALDQIARQQGYPSWSRLAELYSAGDELTRLERSIGDGDLVLVGARPGHGKTSLCIELVARALRGGASCAVFSFEMRVQDLAERLGELGVELHAHAERLSFDDSDEISAAHIERLLEDARPGAWVVVDYLQLLDQRRTNPPLQEQVERLKRLAERKRLRVLCISQIDKRFEDGARAVPGREDVRLPNPLDLSLFDSMCFLHDGRLVFSTEA